MVIHISAVIKVKPHVLIPRTLIKRIVKNVMID